MDHASCELAQNAYAATGTKLALRHECRSRALDRKVSCWEHVHILLSMVEQSGSRPAEKKKTTDDVSISSNHYCCEWRVLPFCS